ncbi:MULTISPECIES: hypothetical protein [Paenibacillus]|uniref:Uncharacterized protein n=1 Tax=Paenibacillus suaedae TaxID=3077233 RepID=A0AAJ2JU91_9BACL|nr:MULTISPECIES: hypothetical protein [Paenibacillus]MDT8976811.1 hypothetical protein [Paenibacillus sp. chi10]GAV12085.1 hypothetical protein PBN151_2014 [Paenibacillus sp. NAIST15-1]SDF01375.1 hypothetical protein SAMN04488689_103337 [Paenibacillus sp. cl6col]
MKKNIEMFLMKQLEKSAEKEAKKAKIVFGAKKLPTALKNVKHEN